MSAEEMLCYLIAQGYQVEGMRTARELFGYKSETERGRDYFMTIRKVVKENGKMVDSRIESAIIFHPNGSVTDLMA